MNLPDLCFLLKQNLCVTYSAESDYHIFLVFLSSVCRLLYIELAHSVQIIQDCR
jgi:hypothetical protein